MNMKLRTISQIDAEIAATKAALENVHGSETEVYARIVGYYRSVRNWNRGKRDEFNHRKMFELGENVMAENSSYEITEADRACACGEPVRIMQEEECEDTLSSENGVSRYELFARGTCPNCPPVKSYLSGVSIPGVAIDVDSSEGLSLAARKGVLAAPTVIVYDSDDNEIARAHNVEELTEIFEPAVVAAV